MLKDRSIICFGGEDWFYHHPHSKTHLMKQFARAGNKVIFVNSISMGLPSIRNRDLLPKIGRKLKSYAKLTRTTPEGITVVSPPTLPFHGNAAARKLNERLLVSQIGRLARRKGMSSPILWIAIPTAANVIGKLGESIVIYQVSDKYDANSEDHSIDPTKIREMHEYCIQKADIVLYSGRKLLEEATLGRDKSYLLEQAVDFAHWSKVRAFHEATHRHRQSTGSPPYEGGVADAAADGVVLGQPSKHDDTTLSIAPEILEIPKPRLGYFGAIEPWLIDRELIKLAGQKHPEWTWIFIGNLARGTDMAEMPNIRLIPAVPYEELPRYAAGFDVCVLPWQTEHAFTSYGSAIKVREYLATGLPVVISPLPEYEHMSDVLRIARSREDFITKVEEALAENDSVLADRRQHAVRDGTWNSRAEWISELIERHLQG
jgi:glycosyltransferase involved in cell wall biosynthesis